VSVCVPPWEAEDGSTGARVTFEHANNVVEIRVSVFERTREDGRNRILGSALIGLSLCPHTDLEDGSRREVCPVPHTRIQLFGRVKTSLKGGNNRIVRRVVVGVAVEPSDGPRKMDVGVDGLGICDAPENPAHTTCVIRVPFPKGFQVPHKNSQSWTVSM